MAVLTQEERDRVRRWYQRDQNLGSAAFTKPNIAAAVTDLDAFMDANATALNTALPLPFRTAATQQQKALLLVYVVCRRYGLNPTALGSD